MEGLADRLQHPEEYSETAPTFVPRTDVLETDKSFELSIELPGMSANDFDIEFHEGRLTISGERTRAEAAEGTTLRRAERMFGKFRRVFALGNEIDSDTVVAKYDNGILFVTCLLYTSPSPRDATLSRMPSSA